MTFVSIPYMHVHGPISGPKRCINITALIYINYFMAPMLPHVMRSANVIKF